MNDDVRTITFPKPTGPRPAAVPTGQDERKATVERIRAAALAQDILDRLMVLWQKPWSEPAYGEAQMLLSLARAALAATAPNQTALDVNRLARAIADLHCSGTIGSSYGFEDVEVRAAREAAAIVAAYEHQP